MNRLYFGDCLTVMEDMPLGSVDLIYLDPPFNSQRDYNAIYKDETGRPLPAQIEAFGDMWALNEERERELRTMPVLMRDAGIPDDSVEFWRLWMNALRRTNPNLLAYLSYMTQRLLPMRSILKPTGSIYLHCDPTASHYIKIMMDAIFGHENFRNEIVWKRSFAHSDAAQGGKRLGSIHDVLLFYTKGDNWTWNHQYLSYEPRYVDDAYRHIEDGTKRRYRFGDLTAAKPGGDTSYQWRIKRSATCGWCGDLEEEWRTPVKGWEYKGIPPYKGRYWAYSKEGMREYETQGRLVYASTGMPNYKRYLDEMAGVLLQDIWTDINPAAGKERLGYATQKPIALLERIIKESTNDGDVVFDPFCGCATTLEAAHKLDRRWIGIDIAIHAIKRVASVRLRDRLGLKEGVDFEIDGVPRDIEGARDLWTRDKYHFQRWAVEQVDGFVTTKRTADGGIDGRLYFSLPNDRDLSSMAIEVKGGRNVGIKDVRELRGVLDNDDAKMAGLVVMHPFGQTKERNIRRFMANAGDMDVMGVKYPRLQALTVEEILDGKKFHTPSVAGRGLAQPNLI